MTITAAELDESELHDPAYIAAVANLRRARQRFGLGVASLVLVFVSLVSSFLGGADPVIGLVIVAAAVAVLVTAAASYRMGEPSWWLRMVYIFAAVQVAGFWVLGLV